MTNDANLEQQIHEAAHFMRERIGTDDPQILLVLGSGLNHVAELVEEPVCIPFADVPHLSESTVSGHVGQFVFGTLAGKQILVMQGRLHGYEGYSAQQVAFPTWLAHELGTRILFATNAAGAIAEGLHPGDFCVISDHINFSGRNPIAASETTQMGPRFFSMENAYDPALRATALRVADELGIHMQEGVYLGILGPSFETPAEIRLFASWGVSTVAMSMIEEIITARQLGMRVLGINMISNYAAGLAPAGDTPLSFAQEIDRVFAAAGEQAAQLIAGIIAATDPEMPTP